MATDTVKPFQGPPPTPDNFPAAFPQLEQAIKKGVNNLDQESQGNLNALRRQMRSNPPKPATVVNLHPFPLTFGSGNRFLRGITIPACVPGEPLAYTHIRTWRTDWEYNESGALEFKAILPIELAAQFVREFSNKDNYGGGVIIYEGEGNPNKVDEVETYDPIGRLLTRQTQGFEFDEENNRNAVMLDIPIKKKLADLIEAERENRNRQYMVRVQKADSDCKRPDGRGKFLVTAVHMLMAEVLFAEHIISKMPEWNLQSALQEGLRDEGCKACGALPAADAYKCIACGNIIDPLEAYMDFAIEYGHAKMEMLSADEMTMVEDEEERRKTKRREAHEALKAKKKAASKPAEDATS